MSSISEQIYSGTATVGRTWSLIVAIIITFISLFFLIGGIILLLRKTKYSNKISASIIDNVKCSPIFHVNGGSERTTYNCNDIKVEYYIDDKKYASKLNIPNINDNKYKKGDKLDIYYNISNLTDINYQSDSSHTLGIVIIVFFVFILLVVWINYWLTTKYKFLAATEGVGDIYRFIK